jgi:hypothetical protein
MKISRMFATVSAACAVCAAGMLTAGAGRAENVLITISGNLVDPKATFILPESPSPDIVLTGEAFGFFDNSPTIGGVAQSDGFGFINSGLGGGLNDDYGYYSITGDQYYTGDESSPTFTVGVYDDQYNNATDTYDTVSITALPEPATWAIMLAGFGVMGGALRARRAVGPGRLGAARGLPGATGARSPEASPGFPLGRH